MPLPKSEDLLAIAHLVRPHGIRGEVSSIALAPPVLDLAGLLEGPVHARFPAGDVRSMSVEGLRPHQDRWLLTLAGVQTMDQAEALRGVDLCLRRDELPELPEGWFWEADLQRCRVVDRALGPVGMVRGLNLAGAQPRLELLCPNGSVVLIPWVKALIIQVDLEADEITTDLPLDFPGLSDAPS